MTLETTITDECLRLRQKIAGLEIALRARTEEAAAARMDADRLRERLRLITTDAIRHVALCEREF